MLIKVNLLLLILLKNDIFIKSPKNLKLIRFIKSQQNNITNLNRTFSAVFSLIWPVQAKQTPGIRLQRQTEE